MKHFFLFSLFCLFLFFLCHYSASGQYSRPNPPNRSEIIEVLDRDGDNKLSNAELVNCKDCQFKCLCDGYRNALTLTENNPDTDGDDRLSETELPDPPDNAITPRVYENVEAIFETVNIDGDDGVTEIELRTCLSRHCHLNCACKKMLKNFRKLAGSDNKIQQSEIPVPSLPPGHEELTTTVTTTTTTTTASTTTETAEEEDNEDADSPRERRKKKRKQRQKKRKEKKKKRKQKRKNRRGRGRNQD